MRADTFMRGFEWPRKRPGEIYTSKLKKLNFRKEYRDCIKRYRDKAWMQSTRYIVTSCHGNDDEMWSTSCLVMQHKPYIVEQPPPLPFISYYHYKKYASMHVFIFSAWA